MRAVLSLLVASAISSGCSFGVAKAPRSASIDGPAPQCTTSMTRPGLDLTAAGVLGLAGLASEDGRAVLIGSGALLGLIGLVGARWVNDCRRQNASYERLELDNEAVAEAEDAADSGAASGASSDADPAIATTEHVSLAPSAASPQTAAPGNACRFGGRCPRGQRCDPLRSQCLSTAVAGTEDQACQARGSCDPGLYCDLRRNVCLPGNLGLEGGACQANARCGRGLECRSGICVRGSQPRRFTTPGSTRRETAPGPPRGGEPPRSDRP